MFVGQPNRLPQQIRFGGKSNGHAMPDTHFFDPESKQVVGGEVKTAKSTGSLNFTLGSHPSSFLAFE